MNEDLQALQALLESLRSKKSDFEKFDRLLTQTATALADIVGLLEKADERESNEVETEPDYSGIIDAIKALQMCPVVHVNVPEALPPVVNVTVPPPPAPTLILPPSDKASGWKLRITQWTELGKPMEYTFTPEE